ncbi:hypothetical protein BGZ74_008184 [Mortierella antarctica]|nr:hypothetical protein BGZ74_008184 [Mortierella antarctica]
MARKIAGVTKDSNQQVYEILESRFGMFLASNTQGAQFSIQCVGPVHGSSPSSTASTSSYLTHMELAGDSGADDPAVDSLLDELQSVQDEDEFLDEEEGKEDVVVKEKDPIAKVMESNAIYDQYQASIQSKSSLAEHIKRALEVERAQRNVAVNHPQEPIGNKQTEQQVDSKQNTDSNLASLTRISSKEDEASIATTASSFSEKVSRGAALLKGAIQKYKKPVVMGDLSNNTSVDTLKLPPFSQPSTRTSSNISDMSTSTSPDENSENNGTISGSRSATRADSGDSNTTLTTTQYEDLGHGSFPTVQILSRPGGHFDGTLRVSHGVEDSQGQEKQENQNRARFLKLQAHHPEMHERCNGLVSLIEPEGISVISDIDDTIKETNVTAGARTILRNTFLKEMREVEGMSQTYQQWWNQGAAVHYVSNSPWQLIPSLLDFFHTHMFPPGSAHLRLHDSVLKTYFMSPPGENKRRCIREILSDFPNRKFILVGDSGEIDMEIYTEMALAYPDQIFRIFIRDITTSRLKEVMATKSSPSPSPQAPSEFQASRSRSFSSILLPKTPINSAVTSGLSSLFSRRGSTVSATESPLTRTESPAELLDEEIAKIESPTSDNTSRQLEVNTRFEPSGPYVDQMPEIPSSSSHIATGVKAITNSILASTMRKSVSLSPSSPRLPTKNSWIQGLVRARSGSVSPRSPLAVESMNMTGYPFPAVEANGKDVSSSSTLSLSEGDDEDTTKPTTTTKEGRERDIFEGFEPIGQEHPIVAKAPPRSRTETWSSSASTSNQLTMMPETPGPIPLGVAGRSKSTANLSSSLADGDSHSNSFSLSTKGPLEVWQERVDKCQKRLPEGMLTLFESAQELQECTIVLEMFALY